MQREVHGVYAAHHLRALGLSRAQIRTAVRRGSLLRLRNGWYARPDADQAVVAAVVAGGALSCVSALRLCKVWVPEGVGTHIRLPRHNRTLGAQRFCLPFGANPPVVRGIDDVHTSVLCAMRCLDAEGAVVVLDSVLHRKLATREQLRQWLSDAPKRVQELLLRCREAEAGTETMTRLRLRRCGVHVRTQVWLTESKRVDLLIGDRLVIECDSVEHHTDRNAYEEDRRRDRELTAKGYVVVRLTYRQIHDEWPAIEQSLLSLVRSQTHLWPRKRQFQGVSEGRTG